MPHNVFRNSIGLFGTRRFGTFWWANLLSNVGTWAQQVAQPWLLLSLGASPILIGLDSFAMSAPVWVLTLAGGTLADHADRRRVIVGFQSAQMLCPILIVILLLAGTVRPWMIILLSLVVGVTDALSMPSFSSIIPSIVEHEQIGAALALNSTQFNISRIAGPAVAGILMSTVGAIGCFVVSALSYLPFIGVALIILPRSKGTDATLDLPDLRHAYAGLRALARPPSMRDALLTTLFSSILCAPLVTFCPVLVKQVLHGDAGQFSLAIAVFGFGGVLGATGLLSIGSRRDRLGLSIGFAIAFGLLLVIAALVSRLWSLMALLILAGISMSVANTAANTVVQRTAPPHLLGQAVSLYILAMRGGGALGSLITGFSVSLVGIREALLINGALAVLVQLFIGRRWLHKPPDLRGAQAPPLS